MKAGVQEEMPVSAKAGPAIAQPIPFRPEGRGAERDAMDVLLILALLLGFLVALLWVARKKGWLNRWIVAPIGANAGLDSGLRLERTLRLSQRSILYRVSDGDARYLVLESAGAAQLVKVDLLRGQDADA